ncbi:hypothetical protein Fmac_005216 [Flemingia macrophylla]|uniref:DM8 domain-containing protein n=1 Tax=Flemingia macrophylla TaxID=520843 RepID=A0ABD1N735_9FABA
MAHHHYANNDFREALRILELGIIKGRTLLHKDLDSSVEKTWRNDVRGFDPGNFKHQLVKKFIGNLE